MEIKTFVRANWDRVLAVLLIVAGVVMLIVGWFGISGTGLVAEQLPYLISAGLGGIALVALGCTAWLSADLQDEWRRMDSIEERLRGLTGPAQPSAAASEVTGQVPVAAATAASNGSGRKPARRAGSRSPTRAEDQQ
jgi:hypothetical protein